MNILWISNAPWTNSAYGMQTDMATQALTEMGHKVYVGPTFGILGMPIEKNGVTTLPHGIRPSQLDLLTLFVKQSRADCIVSLLDMWNLDPEEMRNHREHFPDLPWYWWMPIDRPSLHPNERQIIEECRIQPFPMSEFGKSVLKNESVGWPVRDPVPHAISDGWGLKWTPQERLDARERIGVEQGAHLTVMVAANSEPVPHARKAWSSALLGWWEFALARPDAELFLWTDVSTYWGGMDLVKLIEGVGIDKSRVNFPDSEIMQAAVPDHQLSELVGLGDVLLAPSIGEGFCVPVIEAAACGVPSIVNSGSAQPELCDKLDAGVVLEDSMPLWFQEFECFRMIPSPVEIAEALHLSRTLGYAERKELSDKALELYSPGVMANGLKAVLE